MVWLLLGGWVGVSVGFVLGAVWAGVLSHSRDENRNACDDTAGAGVHTRMTVYSAGVARRGVRRAMLKLRVPPIAYRRHTL